MVPSIDPLTVSLVILKGTLVLPRAIDPFKVTSPVLLVIDPHAVVLDTGRPEVQTPAIQLVVRELALVCTTLRRCKHTVAAFNAVHKGSIISGLIPALFFAFTMVHVC